MIVALDIGEVVARINKESFNSFLKIQTLSSQEFFDSHFVEFQKGHLNAQEFLKIKAKLLKTSSEQLVTAFKNMVNVAFPDLLERLRVPYFFMSNINEIHFEKLTQTLKVSDFALNYSLLSYQVGYLKPDKHFFALLSPKLPCQSLIYIDDHLENLEAAKQFGIFGIHCPSIEALPRILTQYGLI